jgi:hypothetical protein
MHTAGLYRFLVGLFSAVQLLKDCVDVCAERILNRCQIGLVAVCRQLHAVAKATGDVLHQLVRRTPHRVSRAATLRATVMKS